MSKVTIIIPIYNAEKYLKNCIKSIVIQEYEDMEVLLIDDGSTDNSFWLCKQFEEEYSQIRVIHQQNHGSGYTRNTGIQEALGEYLVFVDADDRLPQKNTIAIMVEAMEEKRADIIVGNYQRLYDGKLVPANRHGFTDRTDTTTVDFRFQGFFSGGNLAYVWSKMYRRSFLIEQNLKFQNLIYAEDKMFNFECYLANARYVFLEEDVYIYRKTPDSISTKYRENSWEVWMSIAARTQELLKQKKREKRCGDLVAYTIFFAVFFDAKQEYEHTKGSMKAVKQMITTYNAYPLAHQKFQELAKRNYIKELSSSFWKWMIRGFCLAVCARCYAILALGIKLLIDGKVDEKLSSTGRKKHEAKKKISSGKEKQ